MNKSAIALDEPLVFGAFVSEDEFAAVSAELANIGFRFGAISTDPNLPIWHGEISRDSLTVQLALRTTCRLTGAEFDLVSCHVNLQTHGLDGAFHTDRGDPNGEVTHALNWYVHPYEWPVECGGYLLIGNDTRNLRAVLPARNSAVLLSADTLHCATSPSLRAGPLPRISLALKLRLRNEI
jgi:hypothetical protein